MENVYKCTSGCYQVVKKKPNPLEKLKKLGRRVKHWNWNYRQRRLLLDMPDFLLKDMGITKTELSKEVRKPFWRD